MMVDAYEPLGFTVMLSVDSIFAEIYRRVILKLSTKAATDVFVRDCISLSRHLRRADPGGGRTADGWLTTS